MKTRVAALLCGLLTACNVSLAVPQDAEILCSTEAQCPQAMVCRADRCIREAEIDRASPTLV
ncbi:MAG TPA: hypothetical protein VLC93_19930, partial [Myxococcota bacterium]|nr:hypothetical protein [Myxococcota bacterium]